MTADTVDLDTLRRVACLAGFAWTDTELDDLRPLVEETQHLLRALDTVPLGDAEPVTQYRAV
jgi:hypothetical protein